MGPYKRPSTPSTVANRAMRMYMPFSAWRKYAARGSESTSTLREKATVTTKPAMAYPGLSGPPASPRGSLHSRHVT